MSPFATVREVADWLRLSPNQVRVLIRQGKLEAHYHGANKGVRILWASVHAYSESRRVVRQPPSLSRFQQVEARLRSLKTQDPSGPLTKGA